VCLDGFCQVAPKVCATSQDCPCFEGRQATCNLGACSYGACAGTCDCPKGMVCPSGQCIPDPLNGPGCTSEGDCACGVPCLNNQTGMSFCGCGSNYDCPGGVCERSSTACIPAPATCQSNADCPWNGAHQFCLAQQCHLCAGGGGACYGDDANCGTCNGTKMLCHHDLATPDDDGSSHCAPACASNLDCLVVNFGNGTCKQGRCTMGELTGPCTSTTDCPLLLRTETGVIYSPTCQSGACLPPSCDGFCTCPGRYPGAYVCRTGKCVPAPAKCTTVDDCPCTNGGSVACNEGGVCGPKAY